jgi:hypothetical protein
LNTSERPAAAQEGKKKNGEGQIQVQPDKDRTTLKSDEGTIFFLKSNAITTDPWRSLSSLPHLINGMKNKFFHTSTLRTMK